MNCQITPKDITNYKENEVLIFETNLEGKLIGRAADLAHKLFGSLKGTNQGLTGNCYPIPVKDGNSKTLTLLHIKNSVEKLYKLVVANKDKHYIIPKLACESAGYSVKQIAPMFDKFEDLANCSLPEEFINFWKLKIAK